MRLGPDGKIEEFTVFFRPLPATAAALRLIGAGLGRRKSPARAAIISALARPLAFMTRTGDGIGVRLVRSTLLARGGRPPRTPPRAIRSGRRGRPSRLARLPPVLAA